MAKAVVHCGFIAQGKEPRLLPIHHNPGLEVCYITRGRAVWQVEDRLVEAGPGGVTFTFPWQAHGSYREVMVGVELYWAILALDRSYDKPRKRFGFHPTLGLDAGASRRLSAALTHAPVQSAADADELGRMIRGLVEECRAPGPEHEAFAATLARGVVIGLARAVLGPPALNRPGTPTAERVRGFAGGLVEVCDRPWTLETMAKECRLGRTQFARLYTHFTGDTPINGLNRARIERARRLLDHSTLSVTEIAMRLSFSSSQYFAKVFKEYAGQSPSAYRDRSTRRPPSAS